MIGILAGMGPKSTAPFIDKVVDRYQKTTGAVCDIEFPPMIIYSLPTPFYLDRPIDHPFEGEMFWNPQWQQEVDRLIQSCKEGHPDRKLWETMQSHLVENSVDTLLIACTDLNRVFDGVDLPFHVVDASTALAQAIVNKWISQIKS